MQIDGRNRNLLRGVLISASGINASANRDHEANPGRNREEYYDEDRCQTQRRATRRRISWIVTCGIVIADSVLIGIFESRGIAALI